ncbi:hypothetical protein SBA5_250114 [Candidatus Sulfotelmatomonas gaucii]|uniref:Uncharacterized protein n=1 Tax=Candidatus Sulfuritelmatomonas gaucii TaxID=2043161 RepID=A0A2N9LA01_9BACT|nr:hypothetical protein SBA5_250114 [Candidatus Sulfotelmatomonas gaucii]
MQSAAFLRHKPFVTRRHSRSLLSIRLRRPIPGIHRAIAHMSPQGLLIGERRHVLAQVAIIPKWHRVRAGRWRRSQRSQQPGKARRNGGGKRLIRLLHGMEHSARNTAGDGKAPTRSSASVPNQIPPQTIPESGYFQTKLVGGNLKSPGSCGARPRKSAARTKARDGSSSP